MPCDSQKPVAKVCPILVLTESKLRAFKRSTMDWANAGADVAGGEAVNVAVGMVDEDVDVFGADASQPKDCMICRKTADSAAAS